MDFLKNLFKTKVAKTGIIFIVEDNILYAKSLEHFLNSMKPKKYEIKKFSVGETCLRELDKNPDLIIIDYFLDSQYYDAENGLEIIKKIRSKKPTQNIIVLSSQKDMDLAVDMINKYNCIYIMKDHLAFSKIEEVLNEI